MSLLQCRIGPVAEQLKENMMLLRKSFETLLNAMLEDMKLQEPLYQPTSFWEEASKDIIADLTKNGFDNFRSLKSALDFFVPTYGVPGNTMTHEEVETIEQALLTNTECGSKKHMSFMQMLSGESWALSDYRVYMAGDVKDRSPDISALSESKVGNPAEHFCFDNRWLSRSFLNYLHGICFLKKNIDCSSLSTVLEIGGGFGTLGEIFQQAGDYTYIDVDIPPTAAVASYYLSEVSSENFIDYTTTRNIDHIPVPPVGTKMVICPWQLPKLEGNVDLFVNYISFQEMEPAVVKHYLQQVDRLETRYILLRNLREGKAQKSQDVIYGVETPVTGADYDLYLKNYNLIATNVIPFGYKTVDGFHSELRLYKRL